MIDRLHALEMGGYNSLEWLGLASLVLILLIVAGLFFKRIMRVSVSVEVRKNDGRPAPRTIPTGVEKILVMDDDKVLQSALQQLLTNLGYKVICKDSGEETVAYLKSNGADLVLLDLVMQSGINGIETYRQIRDFRPFQRAIMMSGRADPAEVQAVRNLGVESYLIKPVALPLLANAIRSELDRP